MGSIPPTKVGRQHLSAGFLERVGYSERPKLGDAIISFGTETDVWLTESRNQGSSITGKLKPVSKAGGKRLTRTSMTDPERAEYSGETPAKAESWSALPKGARWDAS